MSKYIFSLVFLVFISSIGLSQGTDKSVIPSSPQSAEFENSKNCKILMGLLNNKDAKRVFYLDDYKDTPLWIVDTGNYFAMCNLGNVNGKKIEILHDTSLINRKHISYVIIHNVTKKRNRRVMKIQQKDTGAFGYITFKKMKGEYVVSKFDIGYF